MYWCVFAFRLPCLVFFFFGQISPNQIHREWLTLHLVAFECVIAHMIWWDGRLRWLHLVPRQSVFWETRCPQSVSTKRYASSSHIHLLFSAGLSFFFPLWNLSNRKPLHQEPSPWRLEAPPSLSQIPATQVMQEEAESFSTLYSMLWSGLGWIPFHLTWVDCSVFCLLKPY